MCACQFHQAVILETKILVGLEMPERNEEPGFKSDYCFLWK